MRGGRSPMQPALPFRTATLDHIQCGHLDCKPEERHLGANLGLYSITFNNDTALDREALEEYKRFREEAERKGFKHFLEIFDPNRPEAVEASKLPDFINDVIVRTLGGVTSRGRPEFLKMVYHGPKAMEELVRYDPHLVVGILGGSSGTTRDAFQLLHDAQKYGAKVALFGRKINNAENQLAFVHFLRLIVEGQVGPVDAVKAYHAVLSRLGLQPHRKLADDLQLTDQAMNYAGTAGSSAAVPRPMPAPSAAVSSNGHSHCQCKELAAAPGGAAGGCGCNGGPVVTESSAAVSRYNHVLSNGVSTSANGRPDFTKMSPAERLSYHRHRLGLGR
jgi:hypothetical protein